jgi:hypothetical protein
MNMNYEYFMGRNLGRYSGEWIIIIKQKVVAHGSSKKIKEMMQRARGQYPGESIFIAKVPEDTVQIL